MTSADRSSALYAGRIRHRRFLPREHAFDYPLYLMYLDLSELDTVFEGRWLWSGRRRNLHWFDRRDHLGDPSAPLDGAVRELVASETGWRPAGPIRLLTHLRSFGHCFNPLSLYYCFDPPGDAVEAIVAEVHNTPWGERHCYVLDARETEADAGVGRHRHSKTFHVSPFLPMDLEYSWRLSSPGERLAVHIEALRGTAKVFDATLRLERREITGRRLAWALARFPAMTLRVVGRIHWEAMRLWFKGIPFHPHPDRRAR